MEMCKSQQVGETIVYKPQQVGETVKVSDGLLSGLMTARGLDRPMCACGATVGLSTHDGSWWCPNCLWAEIECLRAELNKVNETVE